MWIYVVCCLKYICVRITINIAPADLTRTQSDERCRFRRFPREPHAAVLSEAIAVQTIVLFCVLSTARHNSKAKWLDLMLPSMLELAEESNVVEKSMYLIFELYKTQNIYIKGDSLTICSFSVLRPHFALIVFTGFVYCVMASWLFLVYDLILLKMLSSLLLTHDTVLQV